MWTVSDFARWGSNVSEKTHVSPVGVYGWCDLSLRDARSGEVIRTIHARNRIPSSGLQLITEVLRGVSPGPTLFAVGTDTTAAAAGNTALGAQVLIEQITQMDSSGGVLTVRFYLGENQGNGNTLGEAGIFNANSVMLARLVHATFSKTNSVTATYIWTIPFLYTGT